MRILITGAAGMLADEIIPVLLRGRHELVMTDINQRLPRIGGLDIANADDALKKILAAKPDYVFHLGAETNVDLCEKSPDHASLVNTEGTKNVAEACKECGSKLLYISSGAVFDGKKKEPYIESDATGPVSVYGKSKLEGANIIRGLVKDHFIIRAGWMVGGWELDKKFVYKIVQQIKQGKKELKVVNDKFGTPTFTVDFAANLMDVINTERFGTFHMVNNGTCSRYDIALKIVEYMGCQDTVKVDPISSDMFPLPAPRARSEMLYNQKLEEMGLNNMPHWETSLKTYIDENKDKE